MSLRSYEFIAVGGGPAGISAAIEWIEMGGKADEILILEKGPAPIDAIKIFYPDKKMTIANYKNLPVETHGHIPSFPDLTKAQTITYFDELIQKYSLKIQFKTEVFKIEKNPNTSIFTVWGGGEKFESRSVGIGIGILGRPNKPDYKIPNTLKGRIWYDLTSEPIQSNEKILVVGGGDTSSEYAQILVAEKNEVTLCYRGAAFSKMMDQNLNAANRLETEKRLRILLSTSLKEVLDDNGKPKAVFENRDPEIFDRIVYAIGGSTPINFLKTCGIQCEANWPKVGTSGETNISGLYLIGDLAVGKQGGSIITAYNSAFRTVSHIRKKS